MDGLFGSFRNTVPVDYELNTKVLKRVVEAEERFVLRHVRMSTTHQITGRTAKVLPTLHS